MYKLGIDVGGTNTDAVLIDENLNVIADIKYPTSGDIYDGILGALRAVLESSGVDRSQIGQAMLGTTQCTNAIVERKNLAKIGILRIGAPATCGVPHRPQHHATIAASPQNSSRRLRRISCVRRCTNMLANHGSLSPRAKIGHTAAPKTNRAHAATSHDTAARMTRGVERNATMWRSFLNTSRGGRAKMYTARSAMTAGTRKPRYARRHEATLLTNGVSIRVSPRDGVICISRFYAPPIGISLAICRRCVLGSDIQARTTRTKLRHARPRSGREPDRTAARARCWGTASPLRHQHSHSARQTGCLPSTQAPQEGI